MAIGMAINTPALMIPRHKMVFSRYCRYSSTDFNITKFTSRIHNVPPKAPVYSYHCTQLWVTAKTFPRFSQGQENSQFRWSFSNTIQMLIKNAAAPLKLVLLATMWYSRNMSAVRSEFTRIAEAAPKRVE